MSEKRYFVKIPGGGSSLGVLSENSYLYYGDPSNYIGNTFSRDVDYVEIAGPFKNFRERGVLSYSKDKKGIDFFVANNKFEEDSGYMLFIIIRKYDYRKDRLSFSVKKVLSDIEDADLLCYLDGIYSRNFLFLVKKDNKFQIYRCEYNSFEEYVNLDLLVDNVYTEDIRWPAIRILKDSSEKVDKVYLFSKKEDSNLYKMLSISKDGSIGVMLDNLEFDKSINVEDYIKGYTDFIIVKQNDNYKLFRVRNFLDDLELICDNLSEFELSVIKKLYLLEFETEFSSELEEKRKLLVERLYNENVSELKNIKKLFDYIRLNYSKDEIKSPGIKKLFEFEIKNKDLEYEEKLENILFKKNNINKKVKLR